MITVFVLVALGGTGVFVPDAVKVGVKVKDGIIKVLVFVMV
jgi:hypothetical protein